MKSIRQLLITMALLLAASTVLGQQQPQPTPTPTTTPVATTTVEFGGSVEVNVAAGAAQVSFELTQTQFVNIIARSVDGDTNPRIYLYNAADRLIAFSDDYTARREDLNDYDALIEESFLIPGTYKVRIEGVGGTGQVSVSVEAGTGGVLGTGRMTIIRAQIAPGENFDQTLNLQQNELISLTVISESETLDPRIQLRNADDQLLAKNDDTDSFDVVLDVTDAKIENFVVPATGVYTARIRAFSSREFGTFLFIINRYGTLEPVTEEPQEVLTGDILSRGRLTFPLELQAGEVVSVTAKAAGSQLDPQITLLDPDNVIVISNDDHNTNAPDLAQYDSSFTNYIVQMDGTYTLNLESISGRGGYEITITRHGKLNPQNIGAPVDTSANRRFLPPTPAPTVQPETTAEATPAS
jgi:hypothetical protein